MHEAAAERVSSGSGIAARTGDAVPAARAGSPDRPDLAPSSPREAPFTLRGKGVLLIASEGPVPHAVHQALEGVGAQVLRQSHEILDPAVDERAGRFRADQAVATAVRTLGHLDLLVVVLTPQDLPATRAAPAPSLRDRLLVLDVAAAGEFAEQGRPGRIVHVVPSAGGGPAAGATSALDERALLELTRGLAVDLGRHDITVNAIAYGPVEPDGRSEGASAPSVDMSRIPKGRLGRPDDVGATTVFLCADESDYLTGVVLHLDGGHRLT